MHAEQEKSSDPAEHTEREVDPDLLDDEESEEHFESEERRRWREAYQQTTETYTEDFLAALTDPELLTRIMSTWEHLGLVGIANKLTLALYCCLTKDLDQRVHNVWYGESRGGKTTPIERMLKAFDPVDVEAYTRVTPTFIDHCPEITDGKIFYLNQFTQKNQDGKASEYLMGDEILDLLLSEGERVLGTVVRNKPMRLRLHGKPLFISTTNYRPRITTSSRLQLTHANESLDQTEQIMLKKTEFYKTGEHTPVFSSFLMQLTHWFRENCKKNVKIPWADVLTTKLIGFVRKNKALRWRDDIDRIFTWIKVDALIHQEQLQKTENEEIIASPQQWTNVIKLAGEDLIAVMEELPPAARTILEAIYNHYLPEGEDNPIKEFQTPDIAKVVAYSRGTITNSMQILRLKGLIGWRQEGKRKPYHYWVLGNLDHLSALGTEDLAWTSEELVECSDWSVHQSIKGSITHQEMHPVSDRVTIPVTPDLGARPESDISSVPDAPKCTPEEITPKRKAKLEIMIRAMSVNTALLPEEIFPKVRRHGISMADISAYLLLMINEGLAIAEGVPPRYRLTSKAMEGI